MAGNHTEIEKRLWDVADELRANSKLKSSEYSTPVLGLIFLRYADSKFTHAEKKLNAKKPTGSRRTVGKTDYQALGVMFLPEKARYAYLLSRPEGADIGRAINEAMKAIEDENEDLKGVLPKTYSAFDNSLLVTLLKTFSAIPMDIEGDVFGKIYEYFLGEFAKTEGSKGGEFYTPTAIVKLIVEVIEPYHGRIFDPACGSGGMFAQSARFVENHKKNPIREKAQVDLTKVDFEAIRKRFERGQKRAEAERLRRLLEGKVLAMIRLNKSRMDYVAKLQAMIDEYNAGSVNVETFFRRLMDFSRSLEEEDQRAIREGLNDEELAIFDLLTKPDPTLTKKQEAQVKKVAQELLETLKLEKLVLDWRKRQQSRAAVRVCIEEILDRLPPIFTRDLYRRKCDAVYQHVFDSYSDGLHGVYSAAA